MKLLGKLKETISRFNSNSKSFPLVAAVAAGLYPLLYVYYSNFTLVCSWSQFAFYVITFLIFPIVVFSLASIAHKRINLFKKYHKYIFPVLNLCYFAFFMVLVTYGFKKKILAVVLLLTFILAIALYKHIKKVVILQLLMAIIAFIMLIPVLFLPFKTSTVWMEQPDRIEQVKFVKKPNVYIIQPDGYANFSELKKAPYNYDNSDFESFLEVNNFKMYDNFRSNYFSTLSSNTSMFTMKHHYYNNVKGSVHEFYNARKIIIGDNPVVSIFKNNDYKTFLMLQKSYLLVNRSKILYDYCNIDYSEVPYFTRGFGVKKDLVEDLEKAIKNNAKTNNFYFLEQISPGHISTFKKNSEGKDKEREDYLNQLTEANTWLKRIISIINKNDDNALVVVVADHGGFVGFDYTLESQTKQEDDTLIKSSFSTALAIKWPNNDAPSYDDKLKSNVNLFRVLFSYLEDNKAYLNNLEVDKSYLMIYKGAPNGVYEVIDENNKVVFKETVN
nr:sulfatase-like hydrolase/transferase [uncultured Psychroserpens sp.]